MEDSNKLLTLSDACSDALYGGERGWLNVDFTKFVSDCRKAIAFGVKCKNAGFEPPQPVYVTLDNNTEEVTPIKPSCPIVVDIPLDYIEIEMVLHRNGFKED